MRLTTSLFCSLLMFYTILLTSIPSTQSRPATSALSSPQSASPQLLIKLPSTSTISVADFSATGDGVHYDTSAIQSAIDACHHSPTCRHVLLPSPNAYLTATLRLRSRISLHIQPGATLLGGPEISDYDPLDSSKWYVVVAEDAEDVEITGGGTIDGQGLKFVQRFDERKNVMVSWNRTGACLGDECRPRLVGFLRCRNVRVWNVLLTEPAYWW